MLGSCFWCRFSLFLICVPRPCTRKAKQYLHPLRWGRKVTYNILSLGEALWLRVSQLVLHQLWPSYWHTLKPPFLALLPNQSTHYQLALHQTACCKQVNVSSHKECDLSLSWGASERDPYILPQIWHLSWSAFSDGHNMEFLGDDFWHYYIGACFDLCA